MGLAAELGALVGLPALTFAVFALVHARTLNPESDIDPWIYTAIFNNWNFVMHVFGYTYYTARLPYLIPGYLLGLVLSAETLFYVFHAAFFLLGGLAAYFLFRHVFGRPVAMIAYVSLLTSVLYYDSHNTDYYDGAAAAFILAGTACALTARNAQRPWLRTLFAGFFLWAAFTTTIFTVFVIAPLLFIWIAVRWPELRTNARRVVAETVVWLTAGGALLTVLCGAFGAAYGYRFLFFMTQVNAGEGTLSRRNLAGYKFPGYAWMEREPRLLIPLFAIALIAVHVRRLRETWDAPASRFAVGSAVYLGVLFGFYAIWEFFFTGIFFEIPYYASYLDVGILLCLASAVYLALGTFRERGPGLIAAAFACVVGFGVIFFITDYGYPTFAANHLDAISIGLFTVTLVVVAANATRRLRHPVLAVAATTLAALSVNAVGAVSDAGRINFQGTGALHTESRDALNLGMDLIGFMKRHHLQNVAPAMWDNANANPAQNAMLSLYLWGYAWVGLDMPKIDKQMRTLLAIRRPKVLVLLCATADCAGGPDALRNAGYGPREDARALLEEGGDRIWVRAYRLLQFSATGPLTQSAPFYAPLHSKLMPRGYNAPRIVAWTFGGGLPSKWIKASGATMTAAGGEANVTASKTPWDYELVSPTIRLPAGQYRVLLRGSVLNGGLDLGVLDLAANKWLAQSLYWFGQRGFATGDMAAQFQLSESRKVEFVLSNWVPRAYASRWRLSGIRLVPG